MSRVSFILPAYKRRFLKEAIDSILAQTCREFELVVVDDKSPEGLHEVIKEYSWEKNCEPLSDGGKKWLVDGVSVRYYQNSENIGGRDLVAAWNHAMEYATGEWCVLASDDDVYHPDYLAEMFRLQEKYPQCDLFHCRLAVVDTDGKWLRVGEERVEFESQIQMVYSRGAKRLDQVAADFMFRRVALDRIGGFVRFPLAWYSDDATWMELSRRGCGCSPRVLFHFRQSGENISSSYGKTVEGKLCAADMFKVWFGDFSKSLTPESDEDRYLMDGIVDKVTNAVDGLAGSIIGEVKSFREWLRFLRKASMSKLAKRSCVYARFRWILALRLILPRVRK